MQAAPPPNAVLSGAPSLPPPGGRALGRGLARVADMFAWPLSVSHYLELVNPLWSSHVLRARVEDVHDETADARTLTLRPGRGWRPHRAGQFVAVTVVLGGERHVRTYSISSPPERTARDGCLTITVKAIAGGRVSGYLARDVAPGAYLGLGLPQGEFVLPEATPVRPLFVTAGSGVTPVMSMLRSLAASDALHDVVHVHYAPRPPDVIFAAELAELASRAPGYRLHVLPTRDGAGGPSRHFTSATLDELAPDWRRRDCYACGPERLLAALTGSLTRAGLGHRLHVERFHAALAAPPAGVRGGRVRFVASGCDAVTDGGTSLLRVAEEAGLTPPHGCRMGICHTCTATLVAGCVRDMRDNRLTRDAGTKIQICVSAPAGDCTVEL